MNFEALRKPVNVSPIIKLARWSMLVFGIFYGQSKWFYYRSVQTKIRDERERRRPLIQEQERIQSLKRKTDEFRCIAKELGIELPPDWQATNL